MASGGAPRPAPGSHGSDSSLLDAGDVRVEHTSHGTAVRVRSDEGTWVRLVSDRDPARDARAWLSETLGGRELPRHCLVIGPALGHVLDALLELRSDVSVIAIEPYAELAALLEARVTKWAGSGRLLLLAGPGYDGASDAWRALEGADAALMLVSPVLRRHCPSRLQSAIATAERVRFDANANAGARAQFAAPYLLHTLENLGVIGRARDVARLFGRFRGVPVVVAAAGPSLDRSIEDLRAVRDRVLLVAVDTALRPLLYHGLEPDLVVGVDPGAENARHLRNLPPFERAWFVAEPSLHPDCFAPFGGRVFGFRVADHAPWPWLRSAGVECDLLRAWGSVLTCAFDLALRLGADPLVFVGADLAYTNDQPYCRGTAFESDWADAIRAVHALPHLWRRLLASRELIDAPDVLGAKTSTTRAMVAFRDWLVEAAGKAGCEIVNATGAGVLGGGRIRQAALRKCLEGKKLVAVDVTRLAGPPDAGRRERLRRAATEARAALGAERPAGTFAEWLTICRDSARLQAALAAGALQSTPAVAPLRSADAWVLSPVLLAPERTLVLAALAAGEPVPPAFLRVQDSESIDLWCCRVVEALASDADAPDAYQLAIVELARRVEARPIESPRPGPPVTDLASRAEGARRLEGSPASATDTLRLWPSLLARCEPAASNRILAGTCDAIASATAVAASLPGPSISDATSCRLVVESPGAASVLSWTLPFRAVSGALTGMAVQDCVGPSPTRGLVVRHREMNHPLSVRVELDPASSSVTPFDARWVLRSDAFELPCRTLHPFSGSPCYYVTQLRDGRARLVCSDSGVAVDVEADGTVRAVHTWPTQVAGEVEWREGSVAWTCGERPRIYVRDVDGSVADAEMPTRAFVALATDDEVMFPSIDGGAWSWRPGIGCEQLVDTPPVNSIRAVEGGFELDPIVVIEGSSFPRIRLDYTWTWDRVAGTAVRRSSDAAGQSAPVATFNAWTARVYPYSDLVRIAGPAGISGRVHVAHALMAAFAGSSLVVTTGSGLVLCFEDICGRLSERAVARAKAGEAR